MPSSRRGLGSSDINLARLQVVLGKSDDVDCAMCGAFGQDRH